ncbi:hypothetical protein [Streptomyces virginiae]|uniref:hypothetical protein n=1 Tax=Streptomyces virginiae TaxID=1961 RepID=UPI002DBDC1A6|nr:hypothetical protein [Streptomyces sp. CMAA1738]MEC4572960.1 hypothetical protein [Streptomyces sp. CMAA1738]
MCDMPCSPPPRLPASPRCSPIEVPPRGAAAVCTAHQLLRALDLDAVAPGAGHLFSGAYARSQVVSAAHRMGGGTV